MRISKTINILIVIAILFTIFYSSGHYNYFKYGERYNPERNDFKIIEITENLYCTNTNKNLRFSITKKAKDLSIFIDSVGFKGHIDKFIFFDEVHYEEDVFIDVREEGTYFYRCYYYYDNNSKKCTLTKPNNDEGEKVIDCNIIENLFL